MWALLWLAHFKSHPVLGESTIPLAKASVMATLELKQISTTRMATRREYDLLNRLRRVESLSIATNTLGLVFDYQYNQANQRRRIDNGDGTHWVIDYDDLGQMVGGKKYWPDGSAVPGQQFEYDFDDIGNRTAHRYGGDASGQSSKLRQVNYVANSLNQYTSRTNVSVVDLLGLATEGSVVTVGGSTNGVYRRGEYFHRAVTNTANTWPSLTNVVSKSGTSVTNIGSIFIPPTPEAFTHDADGNLTQDGRWDYTWDGENRLIQMESKSGFPAGSKRKLEFEYDWQGRRIKKVSHSAWNGSSYGTVVTTKFIYDGWNLLAELDTSNNIVRSYVWGADLSGTMQGAGGVGGLLFVKESDSTAHFAAYDGNGNVMGLVKGTDGTRTATYEYDPFGQPLRATGSMATANPMRFSTKFTDNETGLLYYGYRYYSPSTGRWPNKDPLGEDGGENLYAFVYNVPIDEIDPVGLAACKSNYRWIVHPPMRDKDLQSPQTITVNTTVRIGENSTVVQRQMLFSGLWGLTITEPSLVGGDCCCTSSGGFKPTFDLIVHSQIYLLDKRSSAWGVDRINSGDPKVDDYWHHSPQWYRRRLVMNHEKKHQAHGKKNYETWKGGLQALENNSYSSHAACLQAVDQAILRTWREFQINEQTDSNALHSGGRR